MCIRQKPRQMLAFLLVCKARTDELYIFQQCIYTTCINISLYGRISLPLTGYIVYLDSSRSRFGPLHVVVVVDTCFIVKRKFKQ